MRLLKGLVWMGLFVLIFSFASNADTDEPTRLYYAVEQDGVVCGYAEVDISNIEVDGRPAIFIDDRIQMNMKAMGASVKGTYHFTYYVDPETGMYFRHTSDIDQGTMKLGGTVTVMGDSVQSISIPGNDTSYIAFAQGTVFGNTRYFPFLINDLVKDSAVEKRYQVFSEVDGTINEVVYTNEGIERAEYAGTSFEALKVGYLDRATMVKATLWVDVATGYLLNTEHPLRSSYLTDSTVVNRLGEADLDKKIFASAGVDIADIKAIEFMRVKAKLEPSGGWITEGSLNVPGQAFLGTVVDNLIEGTFEIKHKRYDGAGAPGFPADHSADESLKEYLEPSDLIESADPDLASKAQEITSGAKDSWEAFKLLSQWVSDEISYDIPGGGTAKRVYELRLGECGGHSNLLAAFSRAVGIPCRVVWGCMYVPGQGGRFGQHAWNEVYMGEAGWIPVDATAEEIDFVDCGHIRLSEMKSKSVSFNPIRMEILDHRLAGPSEVETSAAFEPYLGEYQAQGGVLTVLVQNGCLAVDIPNQMVFELREPNEEGERFFKLSTAASVSFQHDENENVTTMIIDSRMRLPRKADDTAVTLDENVPEEYRSMLGAYTIPMRGQELTVVYRENQLVAIAPGNTTIILNSKDADGRYVGDVNEFAKVAMAFEFDDSGKSTAVNLSNLSICRRMESAEGE